jgi:hypothetical protein
MQKRKRVIGSIILCLYQKEVLRDNVKRSADLYRGLSTRDLRNIAYQSAGHYKLKFPQKWCETEMTGTDRLDTFLLERKSASIYTSFRGN